MAFFPKSPTRPLILLGLGAALIVYVWRGTIFPTRIYDRAGVLAQADMTRLNGDAAGIMNESGVDVRVIIDSFPDTEDLATYARQEARRLGVGRSAGARLLVIDLNTRKLRLEVGPHLEGTFPDAFVGRLLRLHLGGALKHATISETIQSTMMILQHRLREEALGREYDPRDGTTVLDSTLLAMGAGASYNPLVDGPLRMAAASDSTLERLLGPGATPDEALATFFKWLSLPVYLPHAKIMTADSRDYLANELPMTPGYWAFWQYLELGKSFHLVVKGDRAVAYSQDDPLVQPHFLWRTKEGWQMDMLGDLIHTRNMTGTTFSWTLVRTGDAYDQAFGSLYEDYSPLLRFRDGANQPLPWRGDFK